MAEIEKMNEFQHDLDEIIARIEMIEEAANGSLDDTGSVRALKVRAAVISHIAREALEDCEGLQNSLSALNEESTQAEGGVA